NPYGDLDGDGVPELAVGRWPVASPRETTEAVRKVLAYEEATEGGDWQRRVSFVAGTSGAGAMSDAASEIAARTLIAQHIPPAYISSMTYANWHSPYCPEPGLFQSMAVERLNEGCLFWVYLGHGQRQHVDYVRVPQGYYPILDRRVAAGLSCRTAPPIALLMACYTGAIDGRDECLAETLLKTHGGPVAVLASSRVSMPYAMSVLGIELIRGYFTHSRATLGDLQLEAKRDTIHRSRADATSLTLDTLARIINPRSSDLAAERLEHLALFNLLGDPLLRLKHPQAASITTSALTDTKDELVVNVGSPVDGHGKVEIVVRRDRLTFEPPERKNFEPWINVVEFQDVYRRANDSRLAWTIMDVKDGRAVARVRLPVAAVGPCHVRVYVRDDRGNFALGSADIVIPQHATSAQREAGRPDEAVAR
ncbi:MAG TPA: C25 family cysteine peptidase, partial [Pirellulales bacterium]|nr:C25 family cysteine peptidase [Pirellulales bacterium]